MICKKDFPFFNFHFPIDFRLVNLKIRKHVTNWKLATGDWKLSVGYTLIEILVAITIIGLLFSVGYANFRSFSQRQVVLDAARSMQGDLRLAQQMALAGQKPDDPQCDDTKTLNGYNFNIVSTSEYRIQAYCSGVNITTKDVTLSSGASIATPFASPNPILFKVLGNGTNIGDGENVKIIIKRTGTTDQSTVTVSSGGQIQ